MIRQEYYDEFADAQSFESLLQEYRQLKMKVDKLEKQIKINRTDIVLMK